MTDQFAADFAQRQLASELAVLQRDADRLSHTAAAYVTSLQAGHTTSGDANSIVQQAVQLAQRAARYEGMRETAAYLAPAKES